jgi:hypothetical protein
MIHPANTDISLVQNNSTTMAAMRQHQQLLQQQQARQMMAQQMQHMGPGAGGMPMGMQFNQQLHQLRAQGRLPVSRHGSGTAHA